MAIHAIHLPLHALRVDFLLSGVRSYSGGTSRFVSHARLKFTQAYRSAFTLKNRGTASWATWFFLTTTISQCGLPNCQEQSA